MEAVVFLKELHDRSLEYAKALHFDKTHELHFTLVALYGSLIELAGCMLILLESRGKIGVPLLFRTFLETYVEFLNLVREPKYGYHMKAVECKEWLKVFKEAKKGDNPYLSKIASLPNLDGEIEKTEQQLGALKKKGYSPLSICQRFERAGMIKEYQQFPLRAGLRRFFRRSE